MKVAYVEKIRNAEKAAMLAGISEDELIARAATALADKLEKNSDKGKILCVAGMGNNGSDVLEAACILHGKGIKADVLAFGDPTNGYNAARREKAKELGLKFTTDPGGYAVVADGLFGVGLNREVEGEAKDLINKINASGAYVISADIPSGLCAESGYALGAATEANETVSFIALKPGHLLGEGRNYCGKLTVADIGVKCEVVGSVTSEDEAKLPDRKPVSHKGNYGRVKIIGGSETMVGAPLMSYESAVAALRAGAGLVTLCVPRSLAPAYQARVTENTLRLMPDRAGKLIFDEPTINEIISDANAVVFGNGAGKSEDIAKIAVYIARNFSGTLVLDADALNSIAGRENELTGHKCKLILTPHVGEFNRLCGNDNEVSRLKNVITYAQKLDATVCYKSATTVITDGKNVRFNLTGTPALAKGGSGDVLAGIIGAFSCVMPAFNAAVAGCYHFGKAGERAAKRLGTVTSVLAGDVIIDLKYAK